MTMKYSFNIILFLVSIILGTVIGLSSCDSDDDETEPSKMIVGKWKLVKIGTSTAVSEEYLTIKANGSIALDFYDYRKESRVVGEDIYELLEDWAYDEQKEQFSTLIQMGTFTPCYCTLKKDGKEMILTPKFPDGSVFYYFLQYYYIKVK